MKKLSLILFLALLPLSSFANWGRDWPPEDTSEQKAIAGPPLKNQPPMWPTSHELMTEPEGPLVERFYLK